VFVIIFLVIFGVIKYIDLKYITFIEGARIFERYIYILILVSRSE